MLSIPKNALPGTIRGKILLSTAMVTATIATITVSVCFIVFQSFLQKIQLQSAEYNLQVTSTNISAHMENILAFNQWCCSSTDIGRYLEAFYGQSRMPSISSELASLRITASNTYERLKEEYYNTSSSNYIARLVISPENRRNYMQISDTNSSSIPAAADRLYDSGHFQELLNAPGYLWDGLMAEPLSPFASHPILPIVRPIYSLYGSNVTGWCYLAISDRIFLDYLGTLPLEEDSSLYLHIGNHTYQFQYGQLTETALQYQVSSDISSQIVNPENRAYQVILGNGQKRTLIVCALGNGWSVSQILSEEAYNGQRSVYLAIIAGIVLVIFLLGGMLYVLLNKMINRPVALLLDKITDISQGDFAPAQSIEWDNEFGSIGRGINQMAQNVATLMEKRVEDEKQKKDLEYQILQSQINPHFLYNTLNSIKWMATFQNATGIAEMTTALARLLKNVSKGTAALIPLKDELALVKDYFLIQQYRYGGNISIDYQIGSEDLYRCLIHRFTLQPIIENAMFHGIEPKGCAGKIAIRAEAKTDGEGNRLLSITVTDNGIGMSPERIREVLEGEGAPPNDFFRHVGISNVNRRIQYNFGKAYGITIKSAVGEYTAMTITLPYQAAP